MSGTIDPSPDQPVAADSLDPGSHDAGPDTTIAPELKSDSWPDAEAKLIMTRNLNAFLHRRRG